MESPLDGGFGLMDEAPFAPFLLVTKGKDLWWVPQRHSEPGNYAVGGKRGMFFAGSKQVRGGPWPGHLLSPLFVAPPSPALGEAACSDS